MKKTLVLTIIAVALVAAGFAFVEDRLRGPSSNEEIFTMNVNYAVDVEDPRRLAGFADHIFLGEVTTKHRAVYRKGHRTMPWTHYDVMVTENIKGELHGTVSVLQEGGHSPEDGRIYLIHGDQLLIPGAEYLFVTRKDKASNVHVIVPAYGDIRVKHGNDRRALLEGFTTAVEQQIPFPEPKLDR